METKQDWETALVRFLAAFWKHADWKKIARNQFAGDIFEHRVQVASTSPNFRAVSEKLCNTLSFQYPPVSSQLIDFLDRQPQALRSLRREVRYWVALAIAYKEALKDDFTS